MGYPRLERAKTMTRRRVEDRAASGARGGAVGMAGGGSSPQALMREWEEACARHLPVSPADSPWRLSRRPAPADPAQGWKLHVSATVLTAVEVLRKVAPYLTRRGVLFKSPRTLAEVSNINCGLHYGYSQVGKFVTVYPQSPEQALTIARRLHHLTRGMPAPPVPFDERYRPDSCVFYRYGAFNSLTMQQPDGTEVPALRAPDGRLVPDRREPGAAVPAWAADPFPRKRPARAAEVVSPLGTSIFAYGAMSQRGKGGVYKALDVSTRPARRCVLKEGRRHGETAWDGRDGYWWVRHEEKVLGALALAGVGVPAVYTSFRSQVNYYLVTEFIDGSDLQQIISDEPDPLPLRRVLQYGLQLAELLEGIHRAGWVWRDCKPSNLMISGGGVMRPLDFEGAHPSDEPDPVPWGTLGYVPPEWRTGRRTSSKAAQDLYALGAVLHQLCCGQVPEPGGDAGPRPGLPPALDSLIASLLDPRPEARPGAGTASEILRGALREHGDSVNEGRAFIF